MQDQELIPHLFRTEYSKIVSVLSKIFGFAQIEIAEDLASDTFLTASELWGLKGLPPNPKAWLYNVAKNKAKNYLQRESTYKKKIAVELAFQLNSAEEISIDLSDDNISDSQLQMMFSICHPSISVEAQVGLSLRFLCGFGIEEIADAFLTNKETINKRLFRAKEKLREQKMKIEMPGKSEINQRLENVLTTIYLLFNEGYHSNNQNTFIRKDLCLEAIRLCNLLIGNADTNTPATNALLSLMCFHASRFDARTDGNGNVILYEDQRSELWNSELIKKGEYFLNCSAVGNHISKYHLEAAIAFWHTNKNENSEKWSAILQLYNQLLQLEYSPMAALNRTYALYKVSGNEIAIIEAEKLNLNTNHFYFTLLGELYKTIDLSKSQTNFKKALELAKTPRDKQTIEKKLKEIS